MWRHVRRLFWLEGSSWRLGSQEASSLFLLWHMRVASSAPLHRAPCLSFADSPSFALSAAPTQIMFEETLYQNAADGTPFVNILNDQGIIPGIKVSGPGYLLWTGAAPALVEGGSAQAWWCGSSGGTTG